MVRHKVLSDSLPLTRLRRTAPDHLPKALAPDGHLPTTMGRHDGPTVDIGGNLGSWETPATPLDRTSSRRAQRVLLSPDSLTTWYVTWRWQTDVKRGAVAIHVPETVSISGGSHHAASPTRELA